ncbi:glycosyltransferase family 69 protein [Mycena olivaceomarginata]|nr:glycosyltransferase family 69 protein [Mycena olivaceomarginata]
MSDLGEDPAIKNLGYGGWAVYVGYLSLAVLGVYGLWTYEQPVDHRFKPDVNLANNMPKRAGYGTGRQNIFIAAMFHNNCDRLDVLPYWINQMTRLIYYLGPARQRFVSVFESYSSDNSPVLLDGFDCWLEEINIAHRILTRDTESMNTAPPRIRFLAASRNLVMQPLVERGGYERVIFSNDVFVEAVSIVELLNTKGGNHDMACGLDLSYWGQIFQLPSFRPVIRDRLGRIASTLWPYFLEDSGFRAVMADEPAPVFTCWNGIVSIRADPFLPPHLRTGQLSLSPPATPLPPTHPAYPQPANLTPAATPPPCFRASARHECFSSESFNLPYDLRRQFGLQRIYVNPRVNNSYVWAHYVWFKYITRHWAVKWWIEKVENGNGIHLAKLVLGDPARVWQWDGGECHPVYPLFSCYSVRILT